MILEVIDGFAVGTPVTRRPYREGPGSRIKVDVVVAGHNNEPLGGFETKRTHGGFTGNARNQHIGAKSFDSSLSMRIICAVGDALRATNR